MTMFTKFIIVTNFNPKSTLMSCFIKTNSFISGLFFSIKNSFTSVTEVSFSNIQNLTFEDNGSKTTPFERHSNAVRVAFE